MVFTYLYNVFGHFRPKNMLDGDNRTLVVHFLVTEVSNNIAPWVDFLENPHEKVVYGNLTGLQKYDDERVGIISRFSDRVGKESYLPVFLQRFQLVNILRNWEGIILQQPKGILIIFSYEYENIEFVPDWKGNKYEVVAQEIEKRDSEDGNQNEQEYFSDMVANFRRRFGDKIES